MSKTKLELTWIGKEHRPRLEPRILIEDEHLSYHALVRRERDIFDNVLIQGDNLLALKALESKYSGLVKSIFIDPPYNTGSAFLHYDDGVEHSIWLSLMRDRIFALRALLTEDGSIWVTIDDNESHYLKIVMDEIFGRHNFVANVVWQKKSSAQANATWLSDSHDHVLVFAKNREQFRPNKLGRSDKQNSIYKHSDECDGISADGKIYGRGPWFPGDLTLSLASGQRGRQFAKTGKSDNIYPITTPSGRQVFPARGRAWAYVRPSFERLLADNRVFFGKDGTSKPTIKRFLSEIEDGGIVPMTVWHYSEVGENRTAAQEVKALNPDDPFSTPKPEKLLERIISISTNPGDIVLDSFAGSGTTGAVAHKMRRRWILVELGDHCETQIVPRLKKVIDGADLGGVTEMTGWEGGGGYRYYRLAPSLLEQDQFGQWVISKAYNPAMLAEAMCNHFGFTYAPSAEHYWQHGHSSETDFIYVTTNSLTHDQLRAIAEEVGDARSLLICCKAFQSANADGFTNLTIRKIPGAILDRCEWGKDDYSLKIEALPFVGDDVGAGEAAEFEAAEAPVPEPKRRGRPRKTDNSPSLFDVEDEA